MMGSYASEVKKELTGLSVHPEHALSLIHI